MSTKQKAVVWVSILMFACFFAFSFADKDIFTRKEVVKTTQVPGYSQTYNIKKTVSEPNPFDAVAKLSLVLIAAFAYWKVLGLVIPNTGVQVVVFIVSIPIVYAALTAAALGTQL